MFIIRQRRVFRGRCYREIYYECFVSSVFCDVNIVRGGSADYDYESSADAVVYDD